MVNKNRGTKTEKYSVYLDTLEGVIIIVNDIIKKYPNLTLKDFYFESDNDDPYGDNEYPYLKYPRPETDKEMKERIEKEETWERSREESEKALLEQLMKKYKK